MKLRVGLVYDLRKDYLAEGYSEQQVAEFDSESTIDAVAGAIESLGHSVERIGNGRRLAKCLVSGKRWDLVFNLAEGLSGRSREAQVPALLEMYAVPYTMSDPLTCAATLDKAIAKRLVGSHGLNTPRFAVVATPADLTGIRLTYPRFAKPVAEGTGKGIGPESFITTPEAMMRTGRRMLRALTQPLIVEEFLPGREFTVGILGTGPDARVLGTMEIVIRDPSRGTIYSYETKESCETMVDYRSVHTWKLKNAVETLALRSYSVLECRDAGRVDIRCDRNGRPAFMEVNPLPGLHPTHSDLPMIATQEGVTYRQLIGSIIKSALKRYGIRKR